MFGFQFTASKYRKIRQGIILGRIYNRWGTRTFIPINVYSKLTQKAFGRTVN